MPRRRPRSASPAGSRSGSLSRSLISSPRTRFSVSATVRRNSSRRPVTTEARSNSRRSESSSGARRCRTRPARSSCPARTAQITRPSRYTARAPVRDSSAVSASHPASMLSAAKSAPSGRTAARGRPPGSWMVSGESSSPATAAATSLTSRPRSTRSVSRSWDSSARCMAAEWARTAALASASSAFAPASSSSADRVSASARAVSMAIAACAASEHSRATSSGLKTRGARSAAKRTPMTFPVPPRLEPRSRGTPRMATSPSSSTPALMLRVWWKRSSVR